MRKLYLTLLFIFLYDLFRGHTGGLFWILFLYSKRKNMAETTGVQIKLEQQNIKERLNLHVKRRLQQDADNPAESPELLPTDANAKRSKTKDVSKPRKPYQKRSEKPKTEATKCKKGI